MHCIVNELSFRNTFESQFDFETYMLKLLNAREIVPFLRQYLCISNTINQQKILSDNTFFDLVQNTTDTDFKKRVLSWITSSGPFWEDERTVIDDDYFEYEEEDVTDLGLGEAARRTYSGIDSSTFSIEDNECFAKSPLVTQHGLKEEPLGDISINNIWKFEELINVIKLYIPVPNDWNTFYGQLNERYPSLIFSGNLISSVHGKPFFTTVRDRALELLSVLELLVKETGNDGELTVRGLELLNNHFIGEKAWFTAESDTNQREHRGALTFNDPQNEGSNLFCHWHGKIKTPQFRIHFQWPRPTGQKEIKIVYIGPKITVD